MVVTAESCMKMALGENPKRVYNSQSKAPTTRMASAALLREALFKAKEYKEKRISTKRIPRRAKKRASPSSI